MYANRNLSCFYTSQSKSNRKKILVVDDFADNIFLLQFILEEYGYQSYSANSGQSALTVAESTLPDLIFLDVMMPDLDGIEVARRLRSNQITRNIPIVLVTAWSAIEISDEAKELVDGILTKPLELEEVILVLNRILVDKALTKTSC